MRFQCRDVVLVHTAKLVVYFLSIWTNTRLGRVLFFTRGVLYFFNEWINDNSIVLPVLRSAMMYKRLRTYIREKLVCLRAVNFCVRARSKLLFVYFFPPLVLIVSITKLKSLSTKKKIPYRTVYTRHTNDKRLIYAFAVFARIRTERRFWTIIVTSHVLKFMHTRSLREEFKKKIKLHCA